MAISQVAKENEKEQVRSILNKIVTTTKLVFGLGEYGGEYGDLLEKLKKAKKEVMPKEVEEAMNKHRKLTQDHAFRGDALSMREQEILAKELPPLKKIAQQYYESEQLRKDYVKKLETEKKELEQLINYYRARKVALSVLEEPLIIEERLQDERTLKQIKDSIQSARQNIKDVQGGLRLEIIEMQKKLLETKDFNSERLKLTEDKKISVEEKQILLLKIDEDEKKLNDEKLSLAQKIEEHEAAIQNNRMYIIPAKQQFIEDQLDAQKKLEWTMIARAKYLPEEKAKVDETLMRLWGKC